MSELITFAPCSPAQSQAILSAMLAVASTGSAPTPADRAAVAAAAAHVLDAGVFDANAAAGIDPKTLAQALPGDELRRYALELIAVMAFVDGRVDGTKLNAVLEYASAMGVNDDYVRDLSESVLGHISWLAADMARENQASIRGMDPGGSFASQFLPYDDAPDAALAARFHALGELDTTAFGRAFYDHYTVNGYAFPGEHGALSAKFALPHDTAHLISGYSTSFQGEILVSTFTAAMHRSEGMGGHILPVIFSWHLGIQLNSLAVARRGHFDAEKFWTAWERGRVCRVDTFGDAFDFWSWIAVPLQELRDGYGIPPLDAAHAASGAPLPVRGWPA